MTSRLSLQLAGLQTGCMWFPSDPALPLGHPMEAALRALSPCPARVQQAIKRTGQKMLFPLGRHGESLSRPQCLITPRWQMHG